MYKRGIIVGRFQPFHKGHLELFRFALTQCDHIGVVIGSVNKKDKDNPLNFDQRLYLLNKVIKREGIGDMVDRVVGLEDFPDDDKWMNVLMSRIGEFEVSYGHNEWTNGIIGDHGYEVVEGPMYKRESLEGEQIRKLIRSGNEEWKKRVPAYLVADVKKMIS